MPRGPSREKRPADTVGCAIMVAKIATGEVEDELPDGRRKGGLKGGKSRTSGMTAEERSALARKAALARWGKVAVE